MHKLFLSLIIRVSANLLSKSLSKSCTFFGIFSSGGFQSDFPVNGSLLWSESNLLLSCLSVQKKFSLTFLLNSETLSFKESLLTSAGVGTKVKPLLKTDTSNSLKLSFDKLTTLFPKPRMGSTFWQLMPSCVFSFFADY